ncbi:L-threonine ammonia-lyase [Kribbella orskensis]|uniref:L-threonine dehydratase n=1 Tax=Kribbella orskensis TaxID=2512216 RepID=A0ABY2BPQ4_9ACTN|nr:MULTISPECIES: threonine ammonia-lyase IlvA [Kribbella]TCN39891.1 L-threonine ammonia-lyase [Kribbella sp. VKM Ac-2500]TCO27326.1 L-threonine ammonia-lyase [Kribbella orskensis]
MQGSDSVAPYTVDAERIEDAVKRLDGVAVRTPLQRNLRLSARTGADVWLKREDLQIGRSYKLRGAYNLIAQLDDEAKKAGVICASAGNHGQGLAYSCHILDVHGRVYVPRTTPRQKRDRIAALGGSQVDVIVTGDTYDDAAAAALAEATETGATLVPAFDDPRTVAGQGTLAVELVDQLGQAPDVLVVPVGGGGLMAGVATWLAERHPGVRVVGVEPGGAASMAAALAAGEPVTLPHLDSFVDGAAVRRVGEVTLPLVSAAGVEMTSVPEGLVCSEMVELYQTDGLIAEPAGALSAAALGHGVEVKPGETVVCLLSGGNNDVSRYGEILERSLVHEGLKHYFLVTFPQEPGALRQFLDGVLGPDDDITLFEYVKRNNRETGVALVGIEIGRPGDLSVLLDRMDAAPLDIERIKPDSAEFRYLI